MDDAAPTARGPSLPLMVLSGLAVLLAGLTVNGFRVKAARIDGLRARDPARRTAAARDLMTGWTHPAQVAEQLQGERPSVRAAAVRGLFEVGAAGRPEAAESAARLIAPFMKDPDQPVRDLAVQSLVALGPAAAVGAATESLRDTDVSLKDGARRVCEALAPHSIVAILAYAGEEGKKARLRTEHRVYAGNALHGIAKKKNERWTTVMLFGAEAVRARARRLSGEQAYAEMERFLQAGSPLVGDPREPVPGLVDYLNPGVGTEEDQNNIISILDRIGDRRAVLALLNSLSVAATRRAAIGALGRLGDPRAVPALVGLLPRDESNRLEIVIALGRIADPAAGPALVAVGLGSASEPVRAAAADSLRGLGPAAVPALLPALADRAPDDPDSLRAEGAARALGGIDSAAARQAAVGALRHPAARVRAAAAASLGERGDPAALKPLVATLSDGDGHAAGAAARSLARLGARAVAPLVPLLSDPDRAYWAAEALGGIGRPALPALERLVVEGDAAAARAAAVLLGELGGSPGALRRGLARRRDPDFEFAARRSLARLAGGESPSIDGG